MVARWDRTTWAIRIIALLVAGMGLVNLLSDTLPALNSRVALLRDYLPFIVRFGSRLAATLAGFALLLIARGLWRRKRAAWYLGLFALAVSAITHLTKGLDWEEATVSLALAISLVALRRQFYARSDSPSVRHGVIVMAVAIVFTLAYGVTGFFLLDNHFKVDFGFWDSVRQTLAMFFSFNDPGYAPVTRYGRWFGYSIYMVAAGTMGFSLLALLRPALLKAPATDAERELAKTRVVRWGKSSVARFTLFEDKAYWFSTGGNSRVPAESGCDSGGSVVAYAVIGNTAVALGDPIGPPEDLAPTVADFKAFCARNDWQAAFFQTLPDRLDVYREAGFEALCVGQEAIVDLSAFTLSGRANKSLRGHVQRLRTAGYTTELLAPPHSDALMAELDAVSDEWLIEQGGREKQFALGWFDEEYIQDGPVFVVRDPNGHITAFANLIPEYNLNEATVDLMRRRRNAASGTMDLLLVGLFEWAKAQGYATFNLGLSPLMGVGEGENCSTAERTVRFIYENANRFYRYKGLYDYKSKFHPQWSPRYLVYPNAATLPSIAYAVVQANNASQPIWQFWRFLRPHPTPPAPAPEPVPQG